MAGDKGRIRSADDSMLAAVQRTIAALDGSLSVEDSAAATLAEVYARQIDSELPPEVLEKVGNRLLACLEALGATPRARSTIRKGVATGGQPKLSRLRSARQ